MVEAMAGGLCRRSCFGDLLRDMPCGFPSIGAAHHGNASVTVQARPVCRMPLIPRVGQQAMRVSNAPCAIEPRPPKAADSAGLDDVDVQAPTITDMAPRDPQTLEELTAYLVYARHMADELMPCFFPLLDACGGTACSGPGKFMFTSQLMAGSGLRFRSSASIWYWFRGWSPAR